MVDIFGYTCYRSFIRDYYLDQKKRSNKFSYQSFADRAGFSTKTFIPKVISGEKKLAQRSMLLLIKAMKLNKKEALYFEMMVNFNNAKDFKFKEYYFLKLQEYNKNSEIQSRQKNEFYCYGEWYYEVLYELVCMFDWKDDFKVLAKLVKPPITPRQAEVAVKRMLELGHITKDPSGYTQLMKKKPSNQSLIDLAKWRLDGQILRRGIEAFGNKYKEQELYPITLGVSSSTLIRVREEIEKFRDKIVNIVLNKDSKEKVVQLNIQLFPITKSIKS